MWLAEDRDGLYSVAGVVSRQDPAGNSGSEIGQEIDLTAAYAVRPGVDSPFPTLRSGAIPNHPRQCPESTIGRIGAAR